MTAFIIAPLGPCQLCGMCVKQYYHRNTKRPTLDFFSRNTPTTLLLLWQIEAARKVAIQYSYTAFSIDNYCTRYYRVTRRVFSEPVTSKLHLLYTKNFASHLKTPKVTRISAMYTNFSHSIVDSGPICFCMTKNLKLSSRTNKSK